MVYQCYRCFYFCKNKKDMKKHLERKKQCTRSIESYQFKEENLTDLSYMKLKDSELININHEKIIDNIDHKWIYDDNQLNFIINYYKKNNIKKCCFCYKVFFRKYELLRHIEKNQCSILIEKKNEHLKKNSIIESLDQIETPQTQTNQINNFHINVFNQSNIVNNNYLLNNFNDEWDISKIDLQKKLLLLLSDNKYTNTMEEILKNDKNMNVLLNDEDNNGIVFQENKFVNLDNDEIIIRTMYKLYNHLLKFYQEIKNENENKNLPHSDLKKHKQHIEDKYEHFSKNDFTKELVKNILCDIFYNKKDEIIKKFNDFNKYLSIDNSNNKIGF
jgi:hypothetical protein